MAGPVRTFFEPVRNLRIVAENRDTSDSDSRLVNRRLVMEFEGVELETNFEGLTPEQVITKMALNQTKLMAKIASDNAAARNRNDRPAEETLQPEDLRNHLMIKSSQARLEVPKYTKSYREYKFDINVWENAAETIPKKDRGPLLVSSLPQDDRFGGLKSIVVNNVGWEKIKSEDGVKHILDCLDSIILCPSFVRLVNWLEEFEKLEQGQSSFDKFIQKFRALIRRGEDDFKINFDEKLITAKLLKSCSSVSASNLATLTANLNMEGVDNEMSRKVETAIRTHTSTNAQLSKHNASQSDQQRIHMTAAAEDCDPYGVKRKYSEDEEGVYQAKGGRGRGRGGRGGGGGRPPPGDSGKTNSGPPGETKEARRERCLREGLCLYCTEKGHMISDCPKKIKKDEDIEKRKQEALRKGWIWDESTKTGRPPNNEHRSLWTRHSGYRDAENDILEIDINSEDALFDHEDLYPDQYQSLIVVHTDEESPSSDEQEDWRVRRQPQGIQESPATATVADVLDTLAQVILPKEVRDTMKHPYTISLDFKLMEKCTFCEERNHSRHDCPWIIYNDDTRDPRDAGLTPGKTEQVLVVELERVLFNDTLDWSFGLIDGGCTKTVAGARWVRIFIDNLEDQDQSKVKYIRSQAKYKFGDGETHYAEQAVMLPVWIAGKRRFILADILEEVELPLLISLKVLRKLEMSITFSQSSGDFAIIDGIKVSIRNKDGHQWLALSRNESFNAIDDKYLRMRLLRHDQQSSHDDIALDGDVYDRTLDVLFVKNPIRKESQYADMKKLHLNYCHMPSYKMKEIIKKAGQWNDDSQAHLDKVIKDCDVECRKNDNIAPRPRANFEQILKPGQKVAVDLKIRAEGKDILYIVDHCTGFASAELLDNKTSAHIAEKFLEGWHYKSYPPIFQVHSDNGGEFTGQPFESMLSDLNILHTTTAPYHPWQNSLVERLHFIIDQNMKKMCQSNFHDVSEYQALKWATAAYNTTESRSGFSPAQLMFGASYHEDSLEQVSPAMPSQSGHRYELELKLREQSRQNHQQIKTSLKFKEFLNRKSQPTKVKDIKVGDWVWVKRFNSFKGPGQVCHALNADISVKVSNQWLNSRLDEVIPLNDAEKLRFNIDQDSCRNEPEVAPTEPQKAEGPIQVETDYTLLQFDNQVPQEPAEPGAGQQDQDHHDGGPAAPDPPQSPHPLLQDDQAPSSPRQDEEAQGGLQPQAGHAQQHDQRHDQDQEPRMAPNHRGPIQSPRHQGAADHNDTEDSEKEEPAISAVDRFKPGQRVEIYDGEWKQIQIVSHARKGYGNSDSAYRFKYVLNDGQFSSVNAADFDTNICWRDDLTRESVKVCSNMSPVDSSITPDNKICLTNHDDSHKAYVINVPFEQRNTAEVKQAQKDELDKLINKFQSFKAVKESQMTAAQKSKILATTWSVVIKPGKGIDGTDKVKARLCARGDREVGDFRTDSPTASKSSLRLALTVCASYGWILNSIDFSSAFVQGKDIDRELYLRPPPDVRKDNPDLIWKVIKRIYGLKDASRGWYLEVDDTLLSLGGQKILLDYAVYIFFDSNNKLKGIVVVHVDDFCFAGTPSFHREVIEPIKKKYVIGSHDISSFSFTGWSLSQDKTGITVSQNDYLEHVDLSKYEVLENAEGNNYDLLGPEYTQLFKQANGVLGWLVQISKPTLAYNYVDFASRGEYVTLGDARTLCRMLHKAKAEKSILKFPNLGPISGWTIMTFCDASFAKLTSLDSVASNITFIRGKDNKVAALDWSSARLKIPVSSPLAAETEAAIEAEGITRHFKHIINEISKLDIPAEIWTDSKSLHDASQSQNALKDRRTSINIAILRRSQETGSFKMCWTRTGSQLSDSLTKSTANPRPLKETLQSGILPLPILDTINSKPS